VSISGSAPDSARFDGEKQLASFHNVQLLHREKEVIDDLHIVELEKKLRLPDPTKTLEAVWKTLRRTTQQVDVTGIGTGVASGSTGPALSEKKRARTEAEHSKAQGTIYWMRTAIR
jgi:ethanolamine ammonia-lyase small subunit